MNFTKFIHFKVQSSVMVIHYCLAQKFPDVKKLTFLCMLEIVLNFRCCTFQLNAEH